MVFWLTLQRVDSLTLGLLETEIKKLRYSFLS